MTRSVVTGSGGGGGGSLTPSSGNFASGSFGSGLIQVYGVGSHTFTVPTGVTQIRARAWGGGASGGGSFCMKIITGLESGSSISITVGEGALDNATAGSSSVGSYMTAGGASSSAGGTASGGDVNYSGGNGSGSAGGGGAASMFGPGNNVSSESRGGAIGGFSTGTTTSTNLRGSGRGLSGGSYVYASATDAFSVSYLTPDVPSLTTIDLIGTGIGGSAYGMNGANGGGGSGATSSGGFPGGGGGTSGADGLVVVEW